MYRLHRGKAGGVPAFYIYLKKESRFHPFELRFLKMRERKDRTEDVEFLSYMDEGIFLMGMGLGICPSSLVPCTHLSLVPILVKKRFATASIYSVIIL